MNRIFQVFGALALGGCFAGGPPAGVECTQNADCAAGAVCRDTKCEAVCDTASDCPAAEVCDPAGVCVVAPPGEEPVINRVHGNDPDDPNAVVDGFVVEGLRLGLASFSLTDTQDRPVLIAVRSISDGLAEFALPADIVDGVYTLVATNAAGAAQATVELTLPMLTGDSLVQRINSEATTTLTIGVLPVGNASTNVAAGDHNHDSSYAVLSHNHASAYAALGHNHDAAYAFVNHNHDSTYADIAVEAQVAALQARTARAFSAYRSTAWSLNGTGPMQLTYNVESYDPDGLYSTTTGYFTVPGQPGAVSRWHIQAQVAYTNVPASQNGEIHIYVNTTAIASDGGFMATGGWQSVSADLTLSAGDLVSVQLTAGGTDSKTGAVLRQYSRFSAHEIL